MSNDFESFESFRNKALRSGMSRDLAPAQIARMYTHQNQGRVQQGAARGANANAVAQEQANLVNDPVKSPQQIEMENRRKLDLQNIAAAGRNGASQTMFQVAAARNPYSSMSAPAPAPAPAPANGNVPSFSIFETPVPPVQPPLLRTTVSGYADGRSIKDGVFQFGMVDGPGTGRSDDVGPAVLPESGEKAKLSKGEAVLPADTADYLNKKAFGGDPDGIEKLILATHKKPVDEQQWESRVQAAGGKGEVDDFSKTHLEGADMNKKTRGYADGRYDSGATGLSKLIENIARHNNPDHPMNKLNGDPDLTRPPVTAAPAAPDNVSVAAKRGYDVVRGRKAQLDALENAAYADGKGGPLSLKKLRAADANKRGGDAPARYADGKAARIAEFGKRVKDTLSRKKSEAVAPDAPAPDAPAPKPTPTTRKNRNGEDVPLSAEGRAYNAERAAKADAPAAGAPKKKMGWKAKAATYGTGATAVTTLGAGALDSVRAKEQEKANKVDAALSKKPEEEAPVTASERDRARFLPGTNIAKTAPSRFVGRGGDISSETQQTAHTGRLRTEELRTQNDLRDMENDFAARGLRPDTYAPYQAARQAADDARQNSIKANSPLGDPTSEINQLMLAAQANKGAKAGGSGSSSAAADNIARHNEILKEAATYIPEERRADFIRTATALGAPADTTSYNAGDMNSDVAAADLITKQFRGHGGAPINPAMLRDPAMLDAMREQSTRSSFRPGAHLNPFNDVPLSNLFRNWGQLHEYTAPDGTPLGYSTPHPGLATAADQLRQRQ